MSRDVTLQDEMDHNLHLVYVDGYIENGYSNVGRTTTLVLTEISRRQWDGLP